MGVYVIAQIKINDRATYGIYETKFDEIFAKYKGILMSVDEDPVVIEGKWPYTRTVLIAFPSETEVQRWFESSEYQDIAKLRRRSSECNIIMIKRLKNK